MHVPERGQRWGFACALASIPPGAATHSPSTQSEPGPRPKHHRPSMEERGRVGHIRRIVYACPRAWATLGFCIGAERAADRAVTARSGPRVRIHIVAWTSAQTPAQTVDVRTWEQWAHATHRVCKSQSVGNVFCIGAGQRAVTASSARVRATQASPQRPGLRLKQTVDVRTWARWAHATHRACLSQSVGKAGGFASFFASFCGGTQNS